MRAYLPTKEGILGRPRVEALLNKGLDCALVTVVAAPGYGKTQAVSSFLKKADVRLIWICTDYMDNSPICFWNKFIAALRIEHAELAAKFGGLPFPNAPESFHFFLRYFTEEAYKDKRRLVLVIDRYEHISNKEIRTFMRRLLTSAPDRFTLVLICAKRMSVNTDGMLRGVRLLSITMEDLRFTYEEARRLFELHKVVCAESRLKRLVDDMEGWPLALQLAAIHHEEDGREDLVSEKPLALIAELFENEFFLQYPPSFRELLIKLSLFSCFSLEMVRLIGGDVDSVYEAATLHMFITYDYVSRLFIFQKAYRNFLAAKQTLIDEKERMRIYALGGNYFMTCGFYLEAIDSYFSCGDYDGMLEALRCVPQKRHSEATHVLILSYLERLPEEYTKQNSSVDFSRAFHYLGLLELDKAEEILRALLVRTGRDATPESLAMTGEACCAMADIYLLLNDERFSEYFSLASHLLPEGSCLRNEGVLMVGNNAPLFLPSDKAGALDRIVQTVFDAVPFIEQVSNGNGYGYEWLVSAEAAFYTCDLDRARANCLHAIEKAGDKMQYDIVLNAYHYLIRIALFQGNYALAREHLKKVVRIVDGYELTPLYEIRDYIENWFLIKIGALSKVGGYVTDHDPERYGSLRLGLGRSSLCRAYYLMARQDYTEAWALLTQTKSIFGGKGLWLLRLTVEIQLAECHMKLHDQDSSMRAFYRAYRMSYENGLLAPFVEAGNSMRTLIDNARKCEEHEFDPAWLNLVYQKASAYAKQLSAVVSDYRRTNRIKPPSGSKLTRRELEVLGYVAKGLTRDEIAEHLGISVNGIKKHVTGIYNKLGAVNRADAIRIAYSEQYLSG